MTRVYSYALDDKQVLAFDSGLSPESFARAQFSRFLTEKGVIVTPGGEHTTWQASGAAESPGGTMLVCGPDFRGRRLDLLISAAGGAAAANEAIAAVGAWIGAAIALCENGVTVPLWPAAAFIADTSPAGHDAPGTVFFAPENIVARSIQAEGEEAFIHGVDQYVHPDYHGPDAAAFTAAALLYRIFAGCVPFAAVHRDTLREDMREGNFLPVQLAAPGLDEKLAGLMQNALMPVNNSRKSGGQRRERTGSAILKQMREILVNSGEVPEKDSFFRELPDDEMKKLEREKRLFQQKKKITVKSKRFVTRNSFPILFGAVIAVAVFFFVYTIVRGGANKPTTAGMDSVEVIRAYYGAFGELDHQLMEACAARGAAQNDINMVSSLFIITKVRQVYEANGHRIIPADEWLESGGAPSDKPVFGVTDLRLTDLPDGADSRQDRFVAEYTLWLPDNGDAEQAIEAAPEIEEPRLPLRFDCVDELSLTKIRGNWRITEINRSQQQ